MTIENWLTIAGIVMTFIPAVIGLMLVRKVNQISISVDGRLSELLSLTAKSSHAEGVEQQRVDSKNGQSS